MQRIPKKLIAALSLASVSLCSTNVILASEKPQQLTFNLTNVQVDLSKVQVNQDGKFEIPINVADTYEISQIGLYDINNIEDSDISFDFTGLDGETWDLLDNVLVLDKLPQSETILEVVAKLKEESKAVANITYSLENLSVEPVEYPIIGKDFSFKLVAEQGYRLPQRISVMPQDGEENPQYTYNNLTGLVTIKALKTDSYGYLKVNASAVKNTAETDFKVNFDLKNVSLTGETTYGIDEQGIYFVDFSFIASNGYSFPSLASVKNGSKVDQFWFENIENCNSNITVAEYVQSGSVGNMRITGIQKDTVIKLASYYRF